MGCDLLSVQIRRKHPKLLKANGIMMSFCMWLLDACLIAVCCAQRHHLCLDPWYSNLYWVVLSWNLRQMEQTQETPPGGLAVALPMQYTFQKQLSGILHFLEEPKTVLGTWRISACRYQQPKTSTSILTILDASFHWEVLVDLVMHLTGAPVCIACMHVQCRQAFLPMLQLWYAAHRCIKAPREK